MAADRPKKTMAADHNAFANLIWQIADLLRGPYRPPQYERVMLPMTVLRRFDSVLAESKPKVIAAHERHKGGKLAGDALDTMFEQGGRTALPQPVAARFRQAQG
jgi:type I restriction enzyme M protein